MRMKILHTNNSNTTSKLDPKSLEVAKSVGLIKTIRAFTKIFNELCPDCKRKAFENPKIPIEDYCVMCQEKFFPILERLNK